MAENFKHFGLDVTVVEAQDQVLAPLDKEMAAYIHKKMRAKGVDLFLNEPVVAL